MKKLSKTFLSLLTFFIVSVFIAPACGGIEDEEESEKRVVWVGRPIWRKFPHMAYDALKDYPNLEELNVIGGPEERGFAFVVAFLTASKKLKKLRIWDHTVTLEDAKALQGALEKNKTLEELWLFSNILNDKTFELIARGLKDSKVFRVFCVKDWQGQSLIEGCNIKTIISHFQSIKTFAELQLDINDKFTRSAEEALKEAFGEKVQVLYRQQEE